MSRSRVYKKCHRGWVWYNPDEGILITTPLREAVPCIDLFRYPKTLAKLVLDQPNSGDDNTTLFSRGAELAEIYISPTDMSELMKRGPYNPPSTKITTGCRVKKTKRYSPGKYCLYGGGESSFPIGTVGVVQSIEWMEETLSYLIRVKANIHGNTTIWNLDDSELEVVPV